LHSILASNRAHLAESFSVRAERAESFSVRAERAHRPLLHRFDPTPALSDRRPYFDRGSPRTVKVPTPLHSYPLMSTTLGQIFFSPPPFGISPTQRSVAPGDDAYSPQRHGARRRASPRRRPHAPEDHHCVEHLLEPLSSERSPEATGHFFTICHRERLLMVGLLRPFSDPAVASPTSA
jgi:hypothetical protein